MYRRYIIKKSEGDNALQILYQQFHITIRLDKGVGAEYNEPS